MKRISLLRITFIVMASFFAQDLQASTANDIYNRSSHNVLVLEGLDAQGKIQLQASATSLGNDVAVTQCDLLSGADIWVVIQDRHVFSAYPRQRDESRNLCRLDVPGLRTAQLNIVPFEEIRVGQRVYAIGNALGLGLSLSEGLVSGIRDISGESWIQTTAALAPGSEGGALFDENGRLLGMTDYRKRDGQNINFAAPAAWLPQIVERAGLSNTLGKLQSEAASLAHAENWKALAELATDCRVNNPKIMNPGSGWDWQARGGKTGQVRSMLMKNPWPGCQPQFLSPLPWYGTSFALIRLKRLWTCCRRPSSRTGKLPICGSHRASPNRYWAMSMQARSRSLEQSNLILSMPNPGSGCLTMPPVAAISKAHAKPQPI